MGEMRFIGRDKNIQKRETGEENQVSISKGNIVIQHEGKPVAGSAATGYVYLLIDRSASMAGDKLGQAKKGAMNFAKSALAKGYFTGLIQFDSSARLLCEPYKDLSIIEKAIARMDTGDTTHMAKAIGLAHGLLRSISGARAMVIVTDGMPNGLGDPHATLEAGESAKRNGIDIIVIGTDDADQKFLRQLASRLDLGVKVESKKLEKAITDIARMLPADSKGLLNK
jgi:molecular chaperone DnaK